MNQSNNSPKQLNSLPFQLNREILPTAFFEQKPRVLPSENLTEPAKIANSFDKSFEKPRPYQILTISAATISSLESTTANLARYLKQHPELNLGDVAYTLSKDDLGFYHRRMLVCQSIDEAAKALSSLNPRLVFTDCQENARRPVIFMFSGQGAQYVNMALELYQSEPKFRQQIDFCSEVLQPHLKFDLRSVLYPNQEQTKEAEQKLKQTAITQPALFVIEYALAKLWMEWGVQPKATIGHSIGEYVAACLAGVFSLKDALFLVAARGQMMQKLPGGSMLAISLSEKEVQSFLNKELSLALINGPSSCVVSGSTNEIKALQHQLVQQSIECRLLHTSHAFHSKMMEPILEPFTKLVKKVSLNPPQIPYLSNVTGNWITVEQATEPNYWAEHLRKTVRFADNLQHLWKEPEQILLEVGPGRTLSSLAMKNPNQEIKQVVLSSLRHPKDLQSDVAFLLNTLGKLWLANVKIDWVKFYACEQLQSLSLLRDLSDSDNEVDSVQSYSDSNGQHTRIVSPGKNEQMLVDLWQEVLEVQNINLYDNFFELGGDSIKAVRLFAEIENKFGKKLPLSTLFQAPTIEELAGYLQQEESVGWASLVPIQPNGSKPPLFCVHGAGGNVLAFRDLARHLGEEQPFYGLQSRGLDGQESPLATVKEMARCYLQEIKTLQPTGPYFLAGYCLGSKVALEMAQLLRAEGEEVALLAALEPSPFRFSTETARLSAERSYRDRLKDLHYRLVTMGVVYLLKQQSLKILSKFYQSLGLSLPQSVQVIKVEEINVKASREYVARQTYPGKVSIFLTDEQTAKFSASQQGWLETLTGEIEIYEVPGKHQDTLPDSFLKEPYIQVLAEKLRVCLDRAQIYGGFLK